MPRKDFPTARMGGKASTVEFTTANKNLMGEGYPNLPPDYSVAFRVRKGDAGLSNPDFPAADKPGNVINPKDHPADNVPTATEHHDGTELDVQ